MLTDSSGVRCAFCARPTVTAVWIASLPYHEECTHGPGYQRPMPMYAPITPMSVFSGTKDVTPLTENDVRRIVQQMMDEAAERRRSAYLAQSDLPHI